MLVKEQINDPTIKPCPYCGSIALLVSTVDYPNGQDDGYKLCCKCGWVTHRILGWKSNKVKLKNLWNECLQEGDFRE